MSRALKRGGVREQHWEKACSPDSGVGFHCPYSRAKNGPIVTTGTTRVNESHTGPIFPCAGIEAGQSSSRKFLAERSCDRVAGTGPPG
jgi:hypothetical protein